VIADRPLTHYVPLERAAKGVVVTQFEMRAIEAIGLVKMDLLGNRALTTIGECVTLAREAGHAVTIEDAGEADAATAARVAAGDTLNCFQLESPAMRHLLRMLDARTLDDVIAAVAAVRPGPAEMGLKEAFCRRKRGLEPAVYHHPRLATVLGGTLGVMLYEEDVLHVAAAIAGLPLAAGDDLRRAIGHARGEAELAALEAGFVAHARRREVDAATARAVWKDLTRFAAYAFCKAHAAGYGTLGWQSAWLKTRFPAEWAVGILNHHAGMYATWVHVEDLRRRGVTFAAPCAWRSAWDATLERRAAETVVRVGLSRVFGLAESTAARMAAERRARPWASLADVIDRARPTLPEVEALILAGALDRTGRTRPSLLLEARATLGGLHRPRPGGGHGARATATAGWLDGDGGVSVLPSAVAPIALAELPEYDRAERVRGEHRSTGLWFSAHPLDVWPRPGALDGTVSAAALERHVGREITLAGLPCAWRRVETKASREAMMFLTLADRDGLAECVLFPDAYRRWARSLEGAVLRVSGRVGETLGAISLEVRRVEPCA